MVAKYNHYRLQYLRDIFDGTLAPRAWEPIRAIPLVALRALV
jgi:hypothetical protein